MLFIFLMFLNENVPYDRNSHELVRIINRTFIKGVYAVPSIVIMNSFL